jgi:GT2 family glycosyltransferase
MSVLIAMAVYDTEENQRSEYTKATLESLKRTVDFTKHRLIVIDNNSCLRTKYIIREFTSILSIIELPENIGTARAINKAWKFRNPGENCVKLDNDVIINQSCWIEKMEEAIERDSSIGIVGLKRKDLAEYPGHEIEWYNSKLYFLPHESGQSWIPFEEVINLMGTCQMYNSKLLDKIGYLNQPGLYGFDDSLASLRSRLAGFKVGFLPHIQIDHIDNRETPYWQQKRDMAGKDVPEFNRLCEKYASGELPLYYEDKE